MQTLHFMISTVGGVFIGFSVSRLVERYPRSLMLEISGPLVTVLVAFAWIKALGWIWPQ